VPIGPAASDATWAAAPCSSFSEDVQEDAAKSLLAAASAVYQEGRPVSRLSRSSGPARSAQCSPSSEPSVSGLVVSLVSAAAEDHGRSAAQSPNSDLAARTAACSPSSEAGAADLARSLALAAVAGSEGGAGPAAGSSALAPAAGSAAHAQRGSQLGVPRGSSALSESVPGVRSLASPTDSDPSATEWGGLLASRLCRDAGASSSPEPPRDPAP